MAQNARRAQRRTPGADGNDARALEERLCRFVETAVPNVFSRSVLPRFPFGEGLEDPAAGRQKQQDAMCREYRRRRPPKAHERADRVAFAHDRTLRAALSALILDCDELHLTGVRAGTGGREGMIAALMITGELIDRLPLPDRERRSLVEPLELAAQGLLLVMMGQIVPAFEPAKRSAGQKARAMRNREFRTRCVLATHALIKTNVAKSQALKKVFQRARPAATALGLNKLPNGRGFTVETLCNWYERDCAELSRWRRSGSWVDYYTSEVVQRLAHLDLTLASMRNDDVCTLDVASDVLLETPADVVKLFLAAVFLENVDRPLHMVRTRTSSPH